MDKINSGFDASGRPFLTAGATDYLANATEQQIKALIRAMHPDIIGTTNNYILQGVVKTVGVSLTTFSEGYIYCAARDEVFISPNQSVATGGDIIANLLTTYGDGAGTTFADSSVHQILRHYSVDYTIGTLGTGTLSGSASAVNDFDNLVYLYPIVEAGVDINGYTATFERDRFVDFAASDATLNVVTLDVTNAVVGATVILRAPATSGAVMTFGGDTSGLYGLNSNVSPTAATSTFWSMRLTFKGNIDNITAEIWNA